MNLRYPQKYRLKYINRKLFQYDNPLFCFIRKERKTKSMDEGSNGNVKKINHQKGKNTQEEQRFTQKKQRKLKTSEEIFEQIPPFKRGFQQSHKKHENLLSKFPQDKLLYDNYEDSPQQDHLFLELRLKNQIYFQFQSQLRKTKRLIRDLKGSIRQLKQEAKSEKERFEDFQVETLRNIKFLVLGSISSSRQDSSSQKSESKAFQENKQESYKTEKAFSQQSIQKKENENILELQRRVNLLEQSLVKVKLENENLNELLFDYAQKLTRQELQLKEKSKCQSRQFSLNKKIQTLQLQNQNILVKYQQCQKKLDYFSSSDMILQKKNEELALKQSKIDKWTKELQIFSTKIKIDLEQLQQKTMKLNKLEQTLQKKETQRSKNKILKMDLNQKYIDSLDQNRPQKNFKRPISLFSSKKLSSSRSKEKAYQNRRQRSRQRIDIIFDSHHDLRNSKKLSEVGTRLEELRIDIRREIQLMK